MWLWLLSFTRRATAVPGRGNISLCDSRILVPSPQLRAFEQCRDAARPARWPHVQGTQILLTSGGLRGNVFQHVYKAGGTSSIAVFRQYHRVHASHLMQGNPLHLERLDANQSRMAVDFLRGCWTQLSRAPPHTRQPPPVPVVAFVREPVERFLSGYYEILARELMRNPASRKHNATDLAIARSDYASPSERLDAFLHTHNVGGKTIRIDPHVALQTWFLAYDSHKATQNLRVAAIWDVVAFDDVLAAAGYETKVGRHNEKAIGAMAAIKKRFLVERRNISSYAWTALCAYLADDYACLAFDPPPECGVQVNRSIVPLNSS